LNYNLLLIKGKYSFMFRNRRSFLSLTLIIILLIASCRSYYKKNLKFNEYFRNAEFEKADQILEKDKKGPKRNTKLIYFLNRGVVAHALGKYSESNTYFEQAYIFGEDYRKNIGSEALALVSNPMTSDYKGEDFELLTLHYFKALNFVFLNNYSDALVEARRINVKLNALSDKYLKNIHYKNDAFAHYLMGILFESSKEYNNAFTSYRNAYNCYKDDYSKLFGVAAPISLKKDLIRAAALTGFNDQVSLYEKEFGIKNETAQTNLNDVVFLWNNGLSPVKEEWSINFVLVKGADGMCTFVNEEYGMSFPFMADSKEGNGGLGDLKMIRVAFPKYVERVPLYNSASVKVNNETFEMEQVQNINAIAFKSLEDRMLREFSNALLRLATKKAAEMALRNQNQDAGAALGILNAITEKADTRNWQTIPHSIYLTRLCLPEGKNTLSFVAKSSFTSTSKTYSMDVIVKPGKVNFFTFSTFDTKLK